MRNFLQCYHKTYLKIKGGKGRPVSGKANNYFPVHKEKSLIEPSSSEGWIQCLHGLDLPRRSNNTKCWTNALIFMGASVRNGCQIKCLLLVSLLFDRARQQLVYSSTYWSPFVSCREFVLSIHLFFQKEPLTTDMLKPPGSYWTGAGFFHPTVRKRLLIPAFFHLLCSSFYNLFPLHPTPSTQKSSQTVSNM